MKINPLVSIIIPTYNRETTLIKKSINSALNQTYKNIEIIIVDDSPKDFKGRNKVEEYIKSFGDSRINYIQHQENLGANLARNTGIKYSSGDLCAFLDDDDEWELNKIELQVKKIQTSNAALVYCKGRILDQDSKFIRNLNNKLHEGYIFNKLIKGNFIGGNSFIMVKKSVLNDIGLFDENMLSNQDWELFLRISKKYKIDYVDEFLVNYYVHNSGNISSNPIKKLQGWNYLYTLYDNYLEDNRDIKNYWDLNMISIYYKNRLYGKSILYMLKTFIYSPLKFFSYFYKVLKVKIK